MTSRARDALTRRMSSGTACSSQRIDPIDAPPSKTSSIEIELNAAR
jgi:hypothetical protein